MSGWVKISRSITDHWVSQDPEIFALWVRLVIDANHETKQTIFNGKPITINRGQLVFGRRVYSAKTGISEKKLRRAIKLLEKDGMLGQQITNKYSIITITNYDEYQKGASKGPAKGQQNDEQRATSKEDKKLRSNKYIYGFDFSSWPEVPSEQVLDDWFAMRKRIKADVSQTVIDTFGAQMSKAWALGHTPDYCLSEAITRNWRGFKVEWLKSADDKQPSGQRTESPSERSARIARELLARTADSDLDEFEEPWSGSRGGGHSEGERVDARVLPIKR